MSKRPMPYLKLAIVSALFACILFIHRSHTYSEERPQNFVLSEETPISTGHGLIGRSVSTAPIDMLSYGIHFRVPRNYIEVAIHDERDHSLYFKLFTLYPDFRGADSERTTMRLTEADKLWIWGSSPNMIYIITDGGATGRFSTEHDPNTVVFTAEANQPDHPWKYGLLEDLARDHPISDVYFQRPGRNTQGYMVSCANTRELDVCDVFMRISSELIIRYQFHRALLPHWKEIDERVSRLVQSFIIKGDKQ